jgi:uncharacterized protein (TIGR00255 family)
MILSMTGFGTAERSEGGAGYTLDIRSLNNRYFKAAIKLPETLQFLEADVERMVRARLGRGSVNYNLRVRSQASSAGYDINTAALERYVDGICTVRIPDGVQATIDLASITGLPGVCQPPEMDELQRDRQGQLVREMTEEAIDRLLEMRRAEGEVLREDLLAHCERLRKHLDAVEEQAPKVVVEYHERLQSRVDMLLAQAKLELEQDSLMREVAIYADKCDISEELTRLRCHVDQFAVVCDSDEHAGRKLDFLAQEMLREANTIGSKSNNATIARHIIEVKALIDRLKEQVQNVE